MQLVRARAVYDRMRLFVFVAALAGCADSYDHVKTAPEVCAFPSEGLAIRGATNEPQTFRAGEPLHFSFFAASDGCPPNVVAWCNAVIDLDHTIRVDAQIAWNGESPDICSREIHGAGAMCETVIPLANDTYRIIFEGNEKSLAIPSTTDSTFCVEAQRH